ncbi:DUF4124 domain-containing protein [Vibrio genomosp. F10]|uniref:DUF4124 domain-containing protein n=1 Tax=Vibrio genomosp. F10 TaxID=723171 RepID=A0A1B9QY47_9VIBR|nr:DUF4124 domain-containing protein [Vibrio genomosp. F10]OCH75248.1 hypothetical protein A6E14_01915 [Vibrio genomosp. F10]
MKPHILFFITLLFPVFSYTQTIYTWEDDQGVLHLSDSTNGKKGGKTVKTITLPDHFAEAPAPSFESLPNNDRPSEEKGKATTKPEPLSLSFQSPQHDQTIRSNQGHINITANSNRKLLVGEHFQLILNNATYSAPNTTGKWQLKNIDRGSHTISIQAFRDGKLIASSMSITVHLHRASVK